MHIFNSVPSCHMVCDIDNEPGSNNHALGALSDGGRSMSDDDSNVSTLRCRYFTSKIGYF